MASVWININRVTLQHNKEFIMFLFYFNGLTRGILSTPASDVHWTIENNRHSDCLPEWKLLSLYMFHRIILHTEGTQKMCSPIGHNNTKHFLYPIRSRHPLEFVEMVRWESVPRGSSALTWKLLSRLFSRADWLPQGLRGRFESLWSKDWAFVSLWFSRSAKHRVSFAITIF